MSLLFAGMKNAVIYGRHIELPTNHRVSIFARTNLSTRYGCRADEVTPRIHFLVPRLMDFDKNRIPHFRTFSVARGPDKFCIRNQFLNCLLESCYRFGYVRCAPNLVSNFS
ncbi:unnamed protein product [Nesidiocoris tenuis]|uniref:Uncharacterized protein n=1 Tax=Nesidiocoris tenuis TaxID=355587 RepID=A0A6H5HL77_9HEMI|nr:unnamed protein product [Nesidiocoris tenuis]